MAQPRSPLPAKLVVGMISGFDDAFRLAEAELPAQLGGIDFRSPEFPFDLTDYYEEQMGANLKRRFLSFAGLIDPDRLAEIKLQTNALERKLGAEHNWTVIRPINIDPGYVTSSKLVLATAKDYSHRIYIGRGIYAEVTLSFVSGHFEPSPWTYPDYRTDQYLSWFGEVREMYTKALKAIGPSPSSQTL